MHLPILFLLSLSCTSLLADVTGGRQGKVLFGINQSGAEWGLDHHDEDNPSAASRAKIPGTENKQYEWYDTTTFPTFKDQGISIFRINFLMERLVYNTMWNTTLEPRYLAKLKESVRAASDQGSYAMINAHNYGRYNFEIIHDVQGFKQFWKTVAAEFKDNNRVIFDVMNEYNNMDQSLVVELNQAAIDGIRAAGAKSQYITPEGNMFSCASSWKSQVDPHSGLTNGDTMLALHDPENKIIYQFHQYFDETAGVYAECPDEQAFKDRLVQATEWLVETNQVGILGEFAGPSTECGWKVVKEGMEYMNANTNAWVGAIWWAAGPRWSDDYRYDMTPGKGIAWKETLPKLQPYIDKSNLNWPRFNISGEP